MKDLEALDAFEVTAYRSPGKDSTDLSDLAELFKAEGIEKRRSQRFCVDPITHDASGNDSETPSDPPCSSPESDVEVSRKRNAGRAVDEDSVKNNLTKSEGGGGVHIDIKIVPQAVENKQQKWRVRKK